MRILVTGGRDFNDYELMAQKLSHFPADAVLVHGVAKGADRLAAQIWKSWGREVDPHPADWAGPCRDSCRPGHRKPRGDGDYCPAAGVYRNQEMLDSGVDMLVAFAGGRGTADMTKRATEAGVKTE